MLCTVLNSFIPLAHFIQNNPMTLLLSFIFCCFYLTFRNWSSEKVTTYVHLVNNGTKFSWCRSLEPKLNIIVWRNFKKNYMPLEVELMGFLYLDTLPHSLHILFSHFSPVPTPLQPQRTVAAPWLLCLWFSRPEYWHGLPFSSLGISQPRIEPASLTAL